MTDLEKVRNELAELKPQLVDGDQRELARRMEVHAPKISDGFGGVNRNVNFLKSLVAETRKLIAERTEVNTAS